MSEKTSIKDVLQGCVVAFGMYSRLPVFHVEWTERNMRWCMCFFPLVGAVSGLLGVLACRLCALRGLGAAATAAILTVLPVAVTGGIHLDGFLDTADALGSNRSLEERLRIMKDSRTGAFAVIALACFFILQFGLYTEAGLRDVILAGIGFILSRAYSGLALILFPKARSSGLARAFSDAAVGRRVSVIMILWIAAASAAMILTDPARGLTGALIALAVFLWYRSFCSRKFGGITGDTEGFFLQVCELLMLMGVVLI